MNAQPNSEQRFAALDLMRFLAAMSVLLLAPTRRLKGSEYVRRADSILRPEVSAASAAKASSFFGTTCRRVQLEHNERSQSLSLDYVKIFRYD